jgi:hypothetical protein
LMKVEAHLCSIGLAASLSPQNFRVSRHRVWMMEYGKGDFMLASKNDQERQRTLQVTPSRSRELTTHTTQQARHVVNQLFKL